MKRRHDKYRIWKYIGSDRTPANFLLLMIDNVAMKLSVESFLKTVILIPGYYRILSGIMHSFHCELLAVTTSYLKKISYTKYK